MRDKQAFFFEVCNFKQLQGNANKSLTCFYVFDNDKDQTFFNAPALSMKIRTISDFDNTEVKLYATHDTLPRLIVLLTQYCNTKTAVQVAGNNFTFFISPSTDGSSRIKITNSDSISNDFLLDDATLIHFVQTLSNVSSNIITLSLSFIQLAQNNAVLEKLDSINEKLSIIKTSQISSNSDQQYQPQQTPEYAQNALPEYVPAFQPPPVYDFQTPLESPLPMIPQSVSNVAPIQPVAEPDVQIDFDDTPSEDVFVDSFDVSLDDSLTAPLVVPDVENTQPIFSKFDDKIRGMLSEDINTKLKRKVLSLMDEAFNKRITIMEMADSIMFELGFAQGNVSTSYGIISSLTDLCGLTTMAPSTFLRYFKKLELITQNHALVTTNVPMFIMALRMPETYCKSTKLLNDVLLTLYLQYRESAITDEDKFNYACLRYMLAPLWTSYLNAVPSIDYMNSQMLNKFKIMTSNFLVDWDNTWETKIDKFVYDSTLALNYKADNVEKLLHSHCPTMSHCFINPENITLNDVSNLRYIINELRETYSYEGMTIPSGLDFNVFTDLFILAIKTFSKANSITNETPENDLFELYTKVNNECNASNVREEFKGLAVFDTYNQDLLV